MERSRYQSFVRMARNRSKRGGAADPLDLLHDLLVTFLEREIANPSSAYLRGALKRQRAFLARTEARRHSREERFESASAEENPRQSWRWEPEFLASLPPALRQLALLLSADLDRKELGVLLRLRDDALRQRLSALRKRLRAWGSQPPFEAVPPSPLATGPMRRALMELKRLPGFALGSHDPDGHLIAFSSGARSRKDEARQQGGEAACRRPEGAHDEDQGPVDHFHGDEPRAHAPVLRGRPRD